MGFRKGRGSRDAIFQLRTIIEGSVQVNKKVYACFVDYQKAFDRINHEKLMRIMAKAVIPDLERKLIKSLYCKEYGMEVNVKKTGKMQCSVTANGTVLEQVSQYKYLGSWITGRWRYELDISDGKSCILESTRKCQFTSKEKDSTLLCFPSREVLM